MADPAPRYAGLPDASALDRRTESLIPYAELIRDLVDRRLYPGAGTDLVAPSSDAMFDDALRAVTERMIGDRLAGLSPEQFIAAYRSVHGDDALTAALQQLAQLRRRDVDREIKQARMAHEARVSGRLLLRELDAGETLTIGLFDPGRPELAAWRFRDNQQVRPLHRLVQVRTLDPARGQVEVVLDTWTGAVWSAQLRSPLADPLARGALGTRLASAPHEPIAPELTLHAPVVLALHDGDTLAPPQIVGYVETLDRRLLLDAVA